jgi:hypothetical protein
MEMRMPILSNDKEVLMLQSIRSSVSTHGFQLAIKFDEPDTRRKEALRFFNDPPKDGIVYFNMAMWVSFALLLVSLVYYFTLKISIKTAETEESVKFSLMAIFYLQNFMEHYLHAYMRRKRVAHFYLMGNVTIFVLTLNCMAMAFCGYTRFRYTSATSCAIFVGSMLFTQFSLLVTTNEIMLCKRFYDTAFGLFVREKVQIQTLDRPQPLVRRVDALLTKTFDVSYTFDSITAEQEKNLKDNFLIVYDKLKSQVGIMQLKFYANLIIFVAVTSLSYFYFYVECFITFPSASILFFVYSIFIVQYCVAMQILSVNRRVKRLEEQFFIKSGLGVHLLGWKPAEELLVSLIVTFAITTFSLFAKMAKNGNFEHTPDCS